jgi:P-type Ca2+ transporter type 2C
MRGTTDAPDHDGLARPGLFQRQRAPTITIDTSATGLLESAVPDGEPLSTPDPLTPTRRPWSPSIESTEHTPLLSHRPRPITPRHISSPNSKGHDQSLDAPSLLAVPTTRSRGSSFDYHSVSSYGGESVLSTPTTSVYGGSHRKSSEPVPFHLLGDGHSAQLNPEGGHELPLEDNPFAFSPAQLSELFNPKNIAAFCAVGGLQGLVLGLRTDGTSGLSLDETGLDGTVELDHAPEATRPTSAGGGDPSLGRVVHVVAATPIRHTRSEPYVDRKRIFGISRLPERRGKNFLQIMWVTFNDKVLIILTIVAAISLILGLYQDFGQSSRNEGPKVRWVEGVTIIVAVSIVVIVGSLNDYQKEQQFRKLNRKVNSPPYFQKWSLIAW